MPSLVPATLKSISPIKSSVPWISLSILYHKSGSPSFAIKPMAIPLTHFLIGTQASINEREEAHTEAIEVEPLLERTSDTTLIVYGNSSSEGITGSKAFSANLQCPISRLEGALVGLASPVLNGAKL